MWNPHASPAPLGAPRPPALVCYQPTARSHGPSIRSRPTARVTVRRRMRATTDSDGAASPSPCYARPNNAPTWCLPPARSRSPHPLPAPQTERALRNQSYLGAGPHASSPAPTPPRTDSASLAPAPKRLPKSAPHASSNSARTCKVLATLAWALRFQTHARTFEDTSEVRIPWAWLPRLSSPTVAWLTVPGDRGRSMQPHSALYPSAADTPSSGSKLL